MRSKIPTAKNNQKSKSIKFKNHPEFTPNLTPRQIFQLGSFGGTYWRPIYSEVTKKYYQNIHHLSFPKSWWKGIPEDHLSRDWDSYDININKYKVKVGTTLEFWHEKDWIHKSHPYGWVHWYCDFYYNYNNPNRDTSDDDRQIKRWLNLAGPKGRFRNQLINMIKNGKDSPAIRQTLQHWAFTL